MIAAQWKAPLLLGAMLSPLFLAGCSQTASHGMSVASLTDAITPSFARAYRYSGRDKECMERVMFFESNRSSRDGMIAVGTVVMNRLRSGKHGSTICEVVGERGQFAPGVMTRKMNSRAMPDVQEAAGAVLKGERSPKLKNAMFFHTAGLKFPYKNMHYVLVAGGNAFYEKRGRNWQPLPDERMFAYGGSTPDSSTAMPGVMVASAESSTTAGETAAEPAVVTTAVQPAGTEKTSPAKATMVATNEPAPADQTTVASAEPGAVPLPAPRPVAFAGVEPQSVPFGMAEPDAVAAADAAAMPKKARRRTPASAQAVVEVATAEQSEIRTKKKLIVPDNAPVPTARAGFLPSRKAAKQAAPIIETAAEEPIAARFGYTEPQAQEAVLSFTQ